MLLSLILAANPMADAAEYARITPMTGLLDTAEQVVQGEVVGLQSSWTDDGLITTFVTLAVDETLHRSSAPEITFEVPGGTVGDMSLTVPGTPQFEQGQEVLVFLDGSKLRGFGQGAFLVDEGEVWRGLGNQLEATPVRMPIHKVIGDSGAAQSCMRDQVLSAYDDGWSLRSSTIARLGDADARGFSLSLMEGVEYRLTACGDDQAGPLEFVLFDADGRDVGGRVGHVREVDVTFRPPHTGTYTLALYNDSLAADALRTSVAIAVNYR